MVEVAVPPEVRVTDEAEQLAGFAGEPEVAVSVHVKLTVPANAVEVMVLVVVLPVVAPEGLMLMAAGADSLNEGGAIVPLTVPDGAV